MLNIMTSNKILLPIKNNEPQRPQYYGSGLGDVSFVEDDALVPALVFTTHALPFPDLLHNIQRGRTTLSNVYGGLHLDGQQLKPSSV